jgi:glycine/D-amino acid oxidase-like deaminating enzyme
MKTNYYDMIIIGAGFAGCALAYQFSKAKVKTLLIESGGICSGTSSACAGRAQIIESQTDEYLEIVLKGYSKLPDLGDELGVDLEWETPGHLTLLYSEQELSHYQYLTSRLNSHGIEAHMLDSQTLRKIEPHLLAHKCVGAAYSLEGHLNPFKFCLGYMNAARNNGVDLKLNSEVTKFQLDNQRITGVYANGELFSAHTVIFATGAWTGSLTRMLDCELPISFTKAEAMVSQPLPKILSHHIGVSGFYEAVHGQNKIVTLGLGQHRNGSLIISNAIQPASVIDRSSSSWALPSISNQLQRFFPALDPINILRTWSAPSPFSKDSLPVIGWMPQFKNLYIATAFHLAIPTIPLISEEVCRHILQSNLNKTSDFLKPFFPNRFFPNYL